jgi:hypothetical protein
MRGYKSTRKRAKLAIAHCAVCRYVRHSAVCGTCRWRAALAAEEVDGQEMFAFQAEAEEAERLGHVEILEVCVIEIGDPTAPVCEFCGWSTGAEWSDRTDGRLVRARQPEAGSTRTVRPCVPSSTSGTSNCGRLSKSPLSSTWQGNPQPQGKARFRFMWGTDGMGLSGIVVASVCLHSLAPRAIKQCDRRIGPNIVSRTMPQSQLMSPMSG